MYFVKSLGLYLGLWALMVFSACSEQGALPLEGALTDVASVTEAQTLQRSEAEAKAEVQSFLEQMAPQVRGASYTIMGADYVLRSDAAVRGGNLATHDIDTLLYVFNVNDEKTAIVSGDLSSPAVLAVMEGKPQKDMLSQKTGTGFDLVAKNMLNYSASDTTEEYLGELEVYRYLPFRIVSFQTIQKVGPMLKVTWDQNWPYNKDMPYLSNGTRAYAGCVPIAVGQLLTYYKYPQSIGGRTLDWEKIIADPSHDDVSFLVKNLAEDMASEYKLEGTSTPFEDTTADVLNSYGYTCRMKKSFTSEDLLGALLKRSLVLVWGANVNDPRERKSSHVWVVDGFLKRKRTMYQLITAGFKGSKVTTSYTNYFHCNWGWNVFNGYFLADLFTPFDMPKLKENTNRGDSTYKKLGYHYNNHACLFVELPK